MLTKVFFCGKISTVDAVNKSDSEREQTKGIKRFATDEL